MRNGIVSAEEIRRRIEACGGDVRDADIAAVKSKKPIDFIPTHRIGHDITRKELVGEYVRYLTAIHELRGDLLKIPENQRPAHILAEAEKAAAQHFKETS